MSKIRSNRNQGALALYSGKSEQEAMEAARLVYSPANARRFRNSPDVRARLLELFTADRPFLLLDALRAKREREAIAYARISSYFEDEVGEDGKPTGDIRFKGFAALSDEQVAAIASIKRTKLGYEIKLHDKDASLRSIEARVDPIGADASAAGDEKPQAPAYEASDNWSELASQAPAPLPN